MANHFLLLFVIFAALSVSVRSPIKIVIVLVMENRSFDHLLGYLHKVNPEIDGLTGDEKQPINVNDPNGPFVQVNHNAHDVAPSDPHHGFYAQGEQIYGVKHIDTQKVYQPKMNGFVQNAVGSNTGTPMSMFNRSTAPIINNLALDFSVFDKWHVSVPGPTDPNRQFIMSGTSRGVLDNWNGTLWEQKSYFQFLTEHKITWSAYYQDDPWVIMHYKDMHEPSNHKHVFELDKFFTDVEEKKLNQFIFLQPRMTSHKGAPTWQHPVASVAEGERLIKKIYESIRKSVYWNDVAFIVTYDEHGGFYDHVAPPQTGIPAPDHHVNVNGFKFDRQGMRVPTICVSPRIPKGSVFHEPKMKPFPTSRFDGTSIIATANKIFGITDHMTARDAWAGTFEDKFSLATPRTDCPMTLDHIPEMTKEKHDEIKRMPLSDHLKAQVDYYCKFNGHDDECSHKKFSTNYEASLFISDQVELFFNKLKKREFREREDV